MCCQTDDFEDDNDNDACNIESDNDQCVPYEEETIPASNVTRGIQGFPDHAQHDAFCNDDWEQQHNNEDIFFKL